MTTVDYTVGGVAKTLTVDLPAKVLVRADWNTHRILDASIVGGVYDNDPKDMYVYGSVTTAGNKLGVFMLLAKFTDIELQSDEVKAAYDEIISTYSLESKVEVSGQVTLTVSEIVKPDLRTGPSLEDIASDIQASSALDDTAKAALINALTALQVATSATAK